MPARLDQIMAATRQRVLEAKRSADLRDLNRRAEQHNPRGFRNALKRRSQTGVAVIAELKKASPSRGLIRADFDAAALAAELERAGAAALSVLTNERFFQGSLENLLQASAHTELPCLRKDFIIDEFQLLEAKAHSADAVLLIVSALGQSELTGLAQRAHDHSLDVLSEIHDEEELKRAADAGCDVIGVNSRDLRTFHVDLNTAYRLAERMPKNVLRVAESGIHTGLDIARLRAAGYDAFLIGESLMKAESPGQALSKLLVESQQEGKSPV